MKQKKVAIFSSSKRLQPASRRTMAGEKSSPGESSKPEGLRPGGTVKTDAPADADAGGATESAGPALATPPPPRPLSASCCCCGGGAREPVRSCVKVAAPVAEEEEAPPPPPPSASEEGKSAEASVSGPGLASPAPVKSDSAVERGGSARRGRGGGGGRADMVARGGGKRGRLERKREGGRERIPLFFFLVSGVDFGLWRFFLGWVSRL